jgi:putative membrane protein
MVWPIILVVVVVAVVIYLIDSRRENVSYLTHANTALENLKERYARGEITLEEFQKIKKEII